MTTVRKIAEIDVGPAKLQAGQCVRYWKESMQHHYGSRVAGRNTRKGALHIQPSCVAHCCRLLSRTKLCKPLLPSIKSRSSPEQAVAALVVLRGWQAAGGRFRFRIA